MDYLGHHIDAQGIHIAPGKVAAITQAPAPQNVTELRSFLGMVNYYGKFLQNLATLVNPLNNVLRDGQACEWTKECATVFQETKLTSAPVLVHYDTKLPVCLAGHASSYGIGAVLSQVLTDGSEQPVAIASQDLHPIEKNYTQLEKEALYVNGIHFTLVTDHRLPTAIVRTKTGVLTLSCCG